MPASTSPNIEPKLPLNEQIEAARLEIAQLEQTIAKLSADNHEVADATGRLDFLRELLAYLERIQTQTPKASD